MLGAKAQLAALREAAESCRISRPQRSREPAPRDRLTGKRGGAAARSHPSHPTPPHRSRSLHWRWPRPL